MQNADATHVVLDLVRDDGVGDVGGDEHVDQIVDGQHALQPVRFLSSLLCVDGVGVVVGVRWSLVGQASHGEASKEPALLRSRHADRDGPNGPRGGA